MFEQHPDAFKDTLKDEIERGMKLTGQDIARAEVAHSLLWRRFQAFLEKYEYFILPTTQSPPFAVNTPYLTEIAGVRFDKGALPPVLHRRFNRQSILQTAAS
jgi:amidase